MRAERAQLGAEQPQRPQPPPPRSSARRRRRCAPGRAAAPAAAETRSPPPARRDSRRSAPARPARAAASARRSGACRMRMTSGISSPTSVPTSSTSAYSSTRNAALPGSRLCATNSAAGISPPTRPTSSSTRRKVRHQLPLDEARQPRADAHREQVGADDGAELQHRVAEQVAGQRAGGQFVEQPAGGDDEHRGEQRDLGGRDAAGGRRRSRSGSGRRLHRHAA